MIRSQPDVTFVVAAYNSADTIVPAIESALAQRGVTVEVLVVDDCSSDDTRSVVSAIDDPRVRLIALQQNRGPGGARNAGLQQASGRWIATLDSDDTIHPDRLRRMLDRAERMDAEVAVDNIEVVSGDGRRQQMFERAELQRHPTISLAEFIESNVLFEAEHNFGYLKPVFERAFIEIHGLRFDETLRIGEDYIFLASALAKGARCAVEPEPGYVYHIREGSISRVLKIHHVDAMLAADETFLRSHQLDEAAKLAQRKRSRSLREARSFLTLVEQLKTKSLGGAVRTAFSNPAALRHLRMPIAARLRRLTAPRPSPAATVVAAGQPNPGNSPHKSKG
ncbi:glycosyltransferase family 2 protein [Sinorhizobium sp. BG8]|uniref:glycosyltransferase family 2 protein n=1 Tax=Sinorhizobium sp. BG8 TaxID=2613773 RepID=UPI00193D0B2B|nr:glycosyltransferase family 2 protein [Sinorhizobium sp. BG8]QRM57343.1 glycosyltransferase family 2 protein [Sinorhizobium sp. BG8]